jgi:hypothetical protein
MRQPPKSVVANPPPPFQEELRTGAGPEWRPNEAYLGTEKAAFKAFPGLKNPD